MADTFTLTPPKIESHFGITGGHIHHIDNTFGFDQRFPCATPVPGLYSASAGAPCLPSHPCLDSHASGSSTSRALVGCVVCFSSSEGSASSVNHTVHNCLASSYCPHLAEDANLCLL